MPGVPKMPDMPKMPNLPGLPKNLNLKIPANFIQKVVKDFSKPPGPKGPSRPMKYPYTFSAKIAQFPYKFYWNNNWMFRYYPYGVLAALPVFVYISRKSKHVFN